MKDYNFIKGKSVALLIWNTGIENDAHIYLGEIIREHDGFISLTNLKNGVLPLTMTKWKD